MQETDKGDAIKYFPFDDKKVTTTTKKLIVRMLEFEEKDRISFEELFEFCEKNIKIDDIGLTQMSKKKNGINLNFIFINNLY